MSETKFKAGDLVYCPSLTNKIVKLENSGGSSYPFQFYCGDRPRVYFCTLDGKLGNKNLVASIFHATEERHAKLESFYGVEFEKPKPKTTPREIIKHLLTKQKYVLCWVSDYDEHHTRERKRLCVIKEVLEEDGKVKHYDSNDMPWAYAIPIDNNGNEITEIE